MLISEMFLTYNLPSLISLSSNCYTDIASENTAHHIIIYVTAWMSSKYSSIFPILQVSIYPILSNSKSILFHPVLYISVLASSIHQSSRITHICIKSSIHSSICSLAFRLIFQLSIQSKFIQSLTLLLLSISLYLWLQWSPIYLSISTSSILLSIYLYI